jgi:hypothetical protein
MLVASLSKDCLLDDLSFVPVLRWSMGCFCTNLESTNQNYILLS